MKHWWYPLTKSKYLSLNPLLLNGRASEARTRYKPISGRVDRAYATEAVDTGSIPGRVKPKTIKIGIHSFPA